MSTTLEFRNVSKTYAKGEHPAVNGVSLSVRKGEIVALVGESGSGKTTLLRLAAGLEAPDSGEVWIGSEVVASEEIWTPPERRGIGLVFQDGALFPHLTVAQNICYGLHGKTAQQESTAVDFMLAMVGLSGFNQRYPHELSGGERQRLALARALAPQPKVVLLDEPFSNLDPALRRSLREEIRTILNKLNATAIMVTHDTDDALCVGDRVAVFRSGGVEQIGTPHEVYHQPKNGYCARLFGPANRIAVNGSGTRWVRPEDITLLDQRYNGAVPVLVDQLRDAGRFRELLVRYLEGTQPRGEGWIVYDHGDQPLKPGDRRWVTFRHETEA